MAQLAIHGTWKGITALAALLALFALMGYASVASFDESLPWSRGTDAWKTGLGLYAVGMIALVFGFWSREDGVAVGAITGLSLLLILDILLRIGVLAYNGVRIY